MCDILHASVTVQDIFLFQEVQKAHFHKADWNYKKNCLINCLFSFKVINLKLMKKRKKNENEKYKFKKQITLCGENAIIALCWIS